MGDAQVAALSGRRVLIVEDEYLIAAELVGVLEEAGINVIGPAGSVEQALHLIEIYGQRLDGAVLDVNLREERVYPVAEWLAEHGVPYAFTTGYDRSDIPKAYAGAPCYQKPVDQMLLLNWLCDSVQRDD
jgi:DNA-binding NarL/FixJ family response regulator